MAKKIILTEEEMQVFLKKEKLGLSLLAACLLLPLLLWLFLIVKEAQASFVLEEPKVVVIPENSGFVDIMRLFSEQQVVPKPALFQLYLLTTGRATRIQSGTYIFDGKQNIGQIADTLLRGPEDITVVIPEGYNIFEIDKRLASLGLTETGEIIELSQKPSLFDYPFLQFESESVHSLEGFLFPDTYRFFQDASAEEVLKKMLDNFQVRVFDKLDPEMAEDPAGFYNILKLASFVEKEVPSEKDRKIVAGILWKRLERDMLLQVDSGVVYAWKSVNPDWKPQDHSLTSSDIKIKSLYNTYIYKGLPPTPIANPGMAALDAVLNPTNTVYLFYLSARDGQTIFSETLEEHNAAVEQYLR